MNAVIGGDKMEDLIYECRIAFLGNSIQYFNDMPRMMEAFCLCSSTTNKIAIYQDSCFHGNQTLASLWDKGNGMEKKFHSENAATAWNETTGEAVAWDIGAPTVEALLGGDLNGEGDDEKEHYESDNYLGWDFVVMNDHTQSAARPERRAASVDALVKLYSPLLSRAGRLRGPPNRRELALRGPAAKKKTRGAALPVLFMTAAYREHGIKDSADLGSFDEFTEATYEGYMTYRKALKEAMSSSLREPPRIAPVGLAYQRVLRDGKNELWSRLYHCDGFHPSATGTYLQACVLYRTLFPGASLGSDVAVDDNDDHAVAQLWSRARRMQPPNDPENPLPTAAECAYLRRVADETCREHLQTIEERDKV